MWKEMLVNAGDYGQVRQEGESRTIWGPMTINGQAQVEREEDIHKSWAAAHVNGT